MIKYTPSQLRADLQKFGITQKEIAGLFGVHHTNFSQWVNGGRPIPQYIQTGLWFYFEYVRINNLTL